MPCGLSIPFSHSFTSEADYGLSWPEERAHRGGNSARGLAAWDPPNPTPSRRFAFLGNLEKKVASAPFEKPGNLAMLFFPFRRLLVPNGMEAMRMIADLPCSEQTCFVVFCRAALECRLA
jgi:hypothetical protein